MKKFVIIVAGGSGTRMGTEVPKQFLELCGRPVLMHTIEVFFKFDPASRIILVLPEKQRDFWSGLCKEHDFSIQHLVVSGGETRFYSVLNGLSEVKEPGIVFIHDGVRPLVSYETLSRCFESAKENGNAIPVVPVNESLRMKTENSSISVDRSLFYSVQTPQTFRSEQITTAYAASYDLLFTDDASVAEKMGFQISMVEGNYENIKITTPGDLKVAEVFLKDRVAKCL
jgi:2-C-methyl-D-erythritol 4-phosphate cytidylyltransferase